MSKKKKSTNLKISAFEKKKLKKKDFFYLKKKETKLANESLDL